MPSETGTRLIDLSHTVEHGLLTYPGLPAPRISDFLSRAESRRHYAAGTEFQIGMIEMVANTGTYVDAPFHRYESGADLSTLPLAALADLPAVIVRAPGLTDCAVPDALFDDLELQGKALLINTGWDARWGSADYFTGHPFLGARAAEAIVAAGVRLVGIDSLNLDDIRDLSRPAHSIFLGAGIPIVEHLCHLDSLPDAGVRFFAVPVKVRGMGTFPVRAFGLVER